MADAMSGEPDGGGDGDGPNQPLPSAAERADGGDCRGAAARSCEQWRHLERGAASGPAGRRAAAAALSANEAQGGRSSTSTAPPDHRRRLRRARQLRAAGAHPTAALALRPACSFSGSAEHKVSIFMIHGGACAHMAQRSSSGIVVFIHALFSRVGWTLHFSVYKTRRSS